MKQDNAGSRGGYDARADQAAHGSGSPLQLAGLRELEGIERDAIHWLLQLGCVALTVPGMWIITGTGPEVRWGYAVLLAAQPFWLIGHFRERQWGMFAIALIFAALWLRGILNHF